MFAPAQNTRSLADRITTAATSGCSKPQPLHGVGELDVDTEIVGVELELVPGRKPAGFVDVELQRGDSAFGAQAPVTVAIRRSTHVDRPAVRARRRFGSFRHEFPIEAIPGRLLRRYHRPAAPSRRSLVQRDMSLKGGS